MTTVPNVLFDVQIILFYEASDVNKLSTLYNIIYTLYR